MRINHLLPTGSANSAQSIHANDKLADKFADLLKQKSEQHSASASDFDINKLEADFKAWKSKYVQSGIGADRKAEVDNYASSFVALMKKAGQEGGYTNPQAFLQSLSPQDLTVLQKIHCVGTLINPNGLGKEGALNLLLPPHSGKDIDKDGFISMGLGKGWTFPPADAPENVKQAWKEATEGMSTGDELMMATAFFMPLSIPGVTENSPYLGPDASYTDLVRNAIDRANFAKNFDAPWQRENREKQIHLLESFLAKLG